LDNVRTKVLISDGHVQRIAGNKRPVEVLEWKQQGRRTRGSTKGRWMKGIHNAMAEREIEEKQWMSREKSEDASDVS
jgi:hypothetical protein